MSASLVIDVTTDAQSAVAGLDDVGAASRRMASDVDDSGRAAQDQARKLALSADAADELGGKAGKATGALGALSAGFELVGAEKYATGLQSAGMATDFFSGVGDSLNLVMESTIVKTVRAKAATAAHAVTSRAAAAATRVMALGQLALNAAMSANPIGLVVAAVVVLVALMVVLYRRSSTVREIINAVGRAGRTAIQAVVRVVSDLVGWVRDRLPGAFNTARSVIVGAIRLITLPIRTYIDLVGDVIRLVKQNLPAAWDTLKEKAARIGDAIAAPFRAVKDLIDDILDLISKIKVPNIDVPFLRLAAPGTVPGTSSPTGTAPQVVNQITVNGAIDPYSTARQISKLLGDQSRLLGVTG